MDKTRAYGGEVITYDRYTQDRAAIGSEIASARGLTLVPPYDDPDIIAGQGTLGLEVIGQAAQAGVTLDAMLICCSGGGLTAGCALAFEDGSPDTAIYSVEPAGFDDTARSLSAGYRLSNGKGKSSVCDAILIDKPGEMTFRINQPRLAGGLVVTDAEAMAAVAFAYDELKMVVEPGGAVALAAVLSGRINCQGRSVGVVCSGGNVDTATFISALS